MDKKLVSDLIPVLDDFNKTLKLHNNMAESKQVISIPTTLYKILLDIAKQSSKLFPFDTKTHLETEYINEHYKIDKKTLSIMKSVGWDLEVDDEDGSESLSETAKLKVKNWYKSYDAGYMLENFDNAAYLAAYDDLKDILNACTKTY